MNGRRKALIIASGEYDHEGLRQLLSPAADARALATVLGDPQIGGFDVRGVHNETAHVIQARIEDLFSEAVPDDLLLVHLSCHGLKNDSGELFFAARNTRPNRLGSTAIPADFVRRCMRSSRSRQIVLLLDCCYGGAFGQGVAVRAAGDINVFDSFPSERLGGGRGRAVITASSSMEYAFEGDQLADDHRRRPSLFSSAVVEGLATGEADRDEDGWVSLNELYDYVFDKVREQNPNQTPSRDVEMQGELYVARSPRRRVRSAHIPPDLRSAMADANMFTRLGAVTELRSRLISDDLQVAAGAQEALAAIARTDIPDLAEAAATALREVAIRPVERELHFGQVVEGAIAPRRSVRLLGPPLAHACTVRASESWIRIDETAEGIQVSVDTSRVGMLRGEITITGPTGKAVIPVSAEITPAREPPPPAHSSLVPTAGSSTTSTRPPTATDLASAALNSSPVVVAAPASTSANTASNPVADVSANLGEAPTATSTSDVQLPGEAGDIYGGLGHGPAGPRPRRGRIVLVAAIALVLVIGVIAITANRRDGSGSASGQTAASPTTGSSTPKPLLRAPSVVGSVPVGASPNSVAVAPDGKHVYVANTTNFTGTNADGHNPVTNSLSVIDTDTNAVNATIRLGATPFRVVVAPDGRRAYTTIGESNSVLVVDLTGNTVVATIPVGKGPTGLAVSPDGRRILVSNSGDQSISAIDTNTSTVSGKIPLRNPSLDITISADGRLAYAQGENNVSVIDVARNAVIATVPAGSYGSRASVSPDGQRIYFAATSPGNVANLYTFDVGKNALVTTTPLCTSFPGEVVVVAEGHYAYVIDGYNPGAVCVVDTTANKVIGSVTVGKSPTDIAASPDGRRVYVVNYNSDTLSVIDTGIG